MTQRPSDDDLETFLRRQDAGVLVELLLELAANHDAVQARLARMQQADRPDVLAASFRKTLATWQRSTKYHGYAESGDFARKLDQWLEQVANELQPRDPAAALALFEAFIQADATWFEHADDSDGDIGDAVRAACRHWLQAAARCEVPSNGWLDRLLELFKADEYGARDELLRRAELLLDASSLRDLVAQLEARPASGATRGGSMSPLHVADIPGVLLLLADALRDPDIMVRTTLRRSPSPSPQQRETFVRAYLDADRPADAMAWLREPWSHYDYARQDLLATALERLGRFDESSPLRKQIFERALSVLYLDRWLTHLSEPERHDAVAHARELATHHDQPATAAEVLLHLGDAEAAEVRLLTDPGRVDGRSYGTLVPLATALRAHACPRGETVVNRALLLGVLNRAYARAYGHGARYLARLREIAASGVALMPLASHEEFEAEIRQKHGRKPAFWAYVNGTRRDRHDEDSHG